MFILLYILFLTYVAGVIVGWVYAGWATGLEFQKVKNANPNMPIQVNWLSVFYQGIAWVAYFASLAAERHGGKHI